MYSDEAAKTILRMKQERVKTDAIYHQIVERINALVVVEGDAAYAGFVNELNKRIEGYEKYHLHPAGKRKKPPKRHQQAKKKFYRARMRVRALCL